MSANRASLIAQLSDYRTVFSEEADFISRFLDLLKHPDCYQRTHLPGHITGSSWIVDSSRSSVLLVHHAKLNRWLQPGGHADGDEDVLRVAQREAEEETGLKKLKIISSVVFDIDIHLIPQRKDFPAHDHYDVRFLFEADTQEPIIVSEESHDVKWISLSKLETYNAERAVVRLKEKLF